jgi:hypothetical protein
MGALFVFGVIFWAFPIAVANGLGHRRNRTGWPYGLLLGWLGVLILSCTSTLPSVAEMQVRELEAQHKLNEMRQIAG